MPVYFLLLLIILFSLPVYLSFRNSSKLSSSTALSNASKSYTWRYNKSDYTVPIQSGCIDVTNYHLTCTPWPGNVAAQINRHGNCTTVTVDTVILGKFQAACFSKITIELTAFLSCIPKNEMEYNRGCCGCFTASDVKCSLSIYTCIRIFGMHTHATINVQPVPYPTILFFIEDLWWESLGVAREVPHPLLCFL